MDHKIKKNSEDIWQPEMKLVISFWPFLFFIAIFVKNKIKFSEDFW